LMSIIFPAQMLAVHQNKIARRGIYAALLID